jgi:hypothetical protein
MVVWLIQVCHWIAVNVSISEVDREVYYISSGCTFSARLAYTMLTNILGVRTRLTGTLSGAAGKEKENQIDDKSIQIEGVMTRIRVCSVFDIDALIDLVSDMQKNVV